jgi:hypothetical protein
MKVYSFFKDLGCCFQKKVKENSIKPLLKEKSKKERSRAEQDAKEEPIDEISKESKQESSKWELVEENKKDINTEGKWRKIKEGNSIKKRSVKIYYTKYIGLRKVYEDKKNIHEYKF